MGYHIYLFRKEVKENNRDLEFLENEHLVTAFTNEQFDQLKVRLIRYGYQVENESPGSVTFNFKDGKYGVQAMLTRKHLAFSAGFDEDGLFAIMQTASEFTDTGEFKKLDPQEGKWEEL